MCKACREVPIVPKSVEVWNPGALHSHTCTECGREFACYQHPCIFRGRTTHPGDRRRLLCGVCAQLLRVEEAPEATSGSRDERSSFPASEALP